MTPSPDPCPSPDNAAGDAWDICDVVVEMVATRHIGMHAWFQLVCVVGGRRGRRRVAISSTFHDFREGDSPTRRRIVDDGRLALADITAQLIAQGWTYVEAYGSSWWQQRFRRRVA